MPLVPRDGPGEAGTARPLMVCLQTPMKLSGGRGTWISGSRLHCGVASPLAAGFAPSIKENLILTIT